MQRLTVFVLSCIQCFVLSTRPICKHSFEPDISYQLCFYQLFCISFSGSSYQYLTFCLIFHYLTQDNSLVYLSALVSLMCLAKCFYQFIMYKCIFGE